MEGWKSWWGIAAFFLVLHAMDGWKFGWSVAVFLLGCLATQVSSWLAHKLQTREKAAAAAAAAEQRRIDFELQQLIETNSRLHEYRDRFFGFVAAVRKVREAQEQHRTDTESDIRAANATLEAAEGALHGIVGFILDTAVRDRVWKAMDAIDVAVIHALNQDEVDFKAVGSAVNEACDALSTRVRSLYAEQPVSMAGQAK